MRLLRTFRAQFTNLTDKSYMKSGQKANRSGQYEILGPRGGRTGVERTITKGEPFPPTRKPGETYRLSDATKNGSGKK